MERSDQRRALGGFWKMKHNAIFISIIDDVRIYNYARTQEQVEKDYNKGLVKIG